MKKSILYIIATLGILSSCTERIDIELDDTYTRLVVYGSVTTDTTSHFVDLSLSSSYYYNEAPPPVTGATLEITDNTGNTVALTEVYPGRYATPPDYFAVQGRTYTLDITLAEEINGFSHYEAISTVNPMGVIDSIGLLYHPDWGTAGFYEVTCYYQDPPTTDFYMFNLFKNGILITDTINEVFVSSDEFYNGSYTNGIGVGYLDQSEESQVINPGDTITFQGGKISEEYYTFITTLQAETGFQTPLFSGPPSNVKGNISNGAVGYFAAYSVAYASTFMTIEQR